MELKPYAPEYFDKLLRFIQKEYPERNRIEELLRYRLYHLPPKETDWQQNAIIVDDNNEIIAYPACDRRRNGGWSMVV